jgi:hypothetical protein
MKGPIRCVVEAEGVPRTRALLKSAPDYFYSSPGGRPGWKIDTDHIRLIDRREGHLLTKSGRVLPLRGIVQYGFDDGELPERIDNYMFTFDVAGEVEAYVCWEDLHVLEFIDEGGTTDSEPPPRGTLP